MEFYIKKNATLPILKVSINRDGRSDYRNGYNISLDSEIFFSLVDSETNLPKILRKPAGIIPNTNPQTSADTEYFVYYQFNTRDTKKSGKFYGDFQLSESDGRSILPLTDKITIYILDSFILEDNGGGSDPYIPVIPCCNDQNILPSETPIPSKTPTLTPTKTTTPSPTPSVTVSPSITSSIRLTATPTQTPPLTPASTDSVTPTPTPTQSLTPQVTTTQTLTLTPSITPTLTQTPTQTVTPSDTPNPSFTPTTTISLTPSSTITPTPSITVSKTPRPTLTPTTTLTLSPTTTITPTVTRTSL
jgi:hypothetical protein